MDKNEHSKYFVKNTLDVLAQHHFTPTTFAVEVIFNEPEGVEFDLISKTGLKYTFQIRGTRIYSLYAKTEEIPYTLIDILPFRD